MNETDDGIVISFNEVHPLKVPFKIDFIDDGIVICFNEEQSQLIFVMDEGIVMFVIEEHLEKALLSIYLT